MRNQIAGMIIIRIFSMAEHDCQIHTGFNPSTMIKQARMCECHPELTFYVRHWTYKYQPRELHAQHFGWSPGKLIKWMLPKTLPVMHQKCAEKMLVNKNKAQCYTRDIIHRNCHVFVYKIRHVPKQSKTNIITVDGKYRCRQTIQADFKIRKPCTNMHKHTTSLKTHTLLSANAQTIHVQYTYGDENHADVKAFAAAVNKYY